MKKFLFLFSLYLCSCAPYADQSSSLSHENATTIQQFAIVQQTKNTDILSKFKKPSSKGYYSDGRYSYTYVFSDLTTHKNAQNTQRHPANNATVKIATFIFSPDGLLQEWHFDENLRVVQRSKYDAMIGTNIETNTEGEMTGQQFNELEQNTSSGRVFSTFGKPLYAQDIENGEKWLYRDADRGDLVYYLLFKDKTLRHKYSVRSSEQFNASEEALF